MRILNANDLIEFRTLKARAREIELMAKVRDTEESLWAEKVGHKLGVDLTVCRIDIKTGAIFEPENPTPKKTPKKKTRNKKS